MKLVYWEQGNDTATDEELPQTCNTLKKAQARAALLFTNALHEKRLMAPHGAWGDAWAGICDDTGTFKAWLHRGKDSWIWKNV